MRMIDSPGESTGVSWRFRSIRRVCGIASFPTTVTPAHTESSSSVTRSLKPFQVELGETFPKLLEQELAARFSGGMTDYEVIGAGVSGFGTDNELLFLPAQHGHKYQPDVVMVALYVGNDIRNNWYELDVKDSGGLRKPYFVIEDGELAIKAYPFDQHTSLTTRIKVFLNRNVVMYSTLREVRDRLRHRPKSRGGGGGRVPLDLNLFADEYGPEWDSAWAVTKNVIVALRDEVRANGAELFVVMIPTRFQVHEEVWQEKVSASDAIRSGSWDLSKPNAILTDFLKRSRECRISICWLPSASWEKQRAENSISPMTGTGIRKATRYQLG